MPEVDVDAQQALEAKNQKYLAAIYQNTDKTAKLIDKLYGLIDDNSYCKNKLITDAQKAFANKFLDFADRALTFRNDESASTEFRLEDLYEEIEYLLNEAGVEYFYPKENDKLDSSIHKAIDVIETSDKSKDKLICKCISFGYKQNSIVIKPAKVTVFKYIENKQGDK